MTNTSLEVIGYVRCDYKEKFGIPRQSGLTDCATAFIEMLPPYNQAEAFRGLDGFSHIWLLWDFSRAHKNGFTATVKPPKLGGNQRMGVFAVFRDQQGHRLDVNWGDTDTWASFGVGTSWVWKNRLGLQLVLLLSLCLVCSRCLLSKALLIEHFKVHFRQINRSHCCAGNQVGNVSS